MRKLTSNAIGLLLFTAISFISCKKTNNDFVSEVNEKATITSQSFTKQVDYAEANLKKIATEIAKLTDDPAFVNFVHAEASKKFDKEYEVLVEDLKKNTTWASKLNSKLLNDGIAAFKNVGGINGGNFYPQIYLPKMQHDEESNNNNTSGLIGNISTDPILFIAYGGGEPVSGESYPAYFKDSNDSLVYWGLVDEAYSNEHEIWIISLNELKPDQSKLALPTEPCINEYGEPIPGPCTSGGGGGGGGQSSSSDNDPDASRRPPHPDMGAPGSVNSKIENMSIYYHYENWVAGGSEIAIRAVLNCHNNRANGDYNAENQQYRSLQESNYLGRFICKFSRKKINNGTPVNVNYPLQTEWARNTLFTAPVNFDYVIFERDIWPTGLIPLSRSGRANPFMNNPTPSYSQNFRSADLEYVSSTISNTLGYGGTYYNGGSVSVGGIAFNTLSY